MMNRMAPPTPTSLLRWIFQRGHDRIICQVDAGRSFTMSLLPRSGAARTLIETFDNRLQAFHRHAEVAMKLRDFGWTVASYGR